MCFSVLCWGSFWKKCIEISFLLVLFLWGWPYARHCVSCIVFSNHAFLLHSRDIKVSVFRLIQMNFWPHSCVLFSLVPSVNNAFLNCEWHNPCCAFFLRRESASGAVAFCDDFNFQTGNWSLLWYRQSHVWSFLCNFDFREPVLFLLDFRQKKLRWQFLDMIN